MRKSRFTEEQIEATEQREPFPQPQEPPAQSNGDSVILLIGGGAIIICVTVFTAANPSDYRLLRLVPQRRRQDFSRLLDDIGTTLRWCRRASSARGAEPVRAMLAQERDDVRA